MLALVSIAWLVDIFSVKKNEYSKTPITSTNAMRMILVRVIIASLECGGPAPLCYMDHLANLLGSKFKSGVEDQSAARPAHSKVTAP
jgi:hypothetical protein